jgi:antitoxin (DNA-binding transcriptional repressor) of toxin-antitoxin stability system
VIKSHRAQIEAVKATLAQLHRDTAKLVRPVINGRKTVLITDHGQARAKIVPLSKKPDRKKALALLRSMGGLELLPRK